MEHLKLLSLLLDSWNSPVVFADTDHIIRYMNRTAREHYARFGDVVGKSVFACHNENSANMIRDIFLQIQAGADEVLYADNEKHRVFMRAVRDNQGKLLGYYERYEPPKGS